MHETNEEINVGLQFKTERGIYETRSNIQCMKQFMQETNEETIYAWSRNYYFFWVLGFTGIANLGQTEVRLLLKNVKMLCWPGLPTSTKSKTGKKNINLEWTKNALPPVPTLRWRGLSEVNFSKYF